MEELVSQMGELILDMAAAFAVIGVAITLLSGTSAGALRMYIVSILEAAC